MTYFSLFSLGLYSRSVVELAVRFSNMSASTALVGFINLLFDWLDALISSTSRARAFLRSAASPFFSRLSSTGSTRVMRAALFEISG